MVTKITQTTFFRFVLQTAHPTAHNSFTLFDANGRHQATRVWHWIAWHTAGVPLILLRVSTVSEQFLTLEGFSDWVYSLCIIVALFCVAASSGAALFLLRTLSATSDLFLFVYVVTTVFCAVFGYCMMGQPSMCWRRRSKHRTTKVESMLIASKLHLSLDFGDPGGNSSWTASSTRQTCPDESGLSHVSSEDAVGDIFISGISAASCPRTRPTGSGTQIRTSL